MAERFSMDRACTGLKMEDGTRYSCRSGGTVEVDRPDHIAAIKRSPNANYIGSGVRLAIGQGLPDNACNDCGFMAMPWSRECPRCGGLTSRGYIECCVEIADEAPLQAVA